MDNKYWDLTAKQLEGKATPGEQEELRRWLEADPEHKKQYQAQQELWRLTAPGPDPEVDANRAWQKVKAGIQPEQEKKNRVPGLFELLPMAYRVAASVALLFGIFWLSRYLFYPYYGMEVIETGSSQISIMLPDSSQVWLNRESKLIYDPDFDGTERLVQLEGEAFFEVRKNPERPFLIQANNTQTKVLGTSFNLRAYLHEPTVELVVATGKVSFSSINGSSEAIVRAGDAATLERESAAIVQYSNPNENAWSWRSGRLKFEGQDLQSVLRDLERYYGVELQLQNPAIANCRFTGSFDQAELEGVLQVLAATLQLEYRKQDNQTLIISGQGCK